MAAGDWFENLTGFKEDGYAATRERLAVEGEELVSRVNGRRIAIGWLEVCKLEDLRRRVPTDEGQAGRTRVSCLVGDARALHSEPEFAGALIQVASQFNLLEMVSPNVSPEDGVTRYRDDPTQGPACAIAAGGATIYRNYFAPVGDEQGQTARRQIDALAPLGEALATLLGRRVRSLWEMRNGYALATPDGLSAIGSLLREASPELLDTLRGQLAIGLHTQVEVTDLPAGEKRRVSQAFCSALPVAYTRIAPPAWEPFARLVLEAAYEATLLAAVQQHRQGGSKTVLLTRVGGGVFGNSPGWVDGAIELALGRVAHCGLDVRLVSFGSVNPAMMAIAERWSAAA